MSGPRISVVVAVHDGERYLGAAIQSAVDQHPRPHQVIVVDDGSADASREVADGFGPPVRCISQDQRGIAAARNAGVARSEGDYVAFLDADDLWTPQAFSCRLKKFADDPKLDLVCGHMREFLSPDLEEEMAGRLWCRAGLRPAYLAGGALIRRSAFEQVGGFREDVAAGEFLDWLARAREHGLQEALSEEHVLWRRIHGANFGLEHAEARKDYARVLKWALDRRRVAAGAVSPAKNPPGA